ncbi:hypothetical protein BGZ65_001655 [Modicella reniformis]|uniref:RlpA-like protein double-psi beta-barrel domain-containing protein n=1 Tax=Modicella reniformis TaxID=1440133 RepID=A0A9P6MIQ5_9FUNG|nr:hypothetical protein BGZ65_001655 [Modicella reniformis]
MRIAELTIFIAFAILAVLTSTTEAKQSIKYGKKVSGKSTWFDGHQLKGAACYGIILHKDINAKDNWYIGAVRMSSFEGGVRGACFECAKVTANRRSVIVRLIDDCTSCSSDQIDLTASAFKILAPLKEGVIKMQYEFVRCPTSGSLKWPSNPVPKRK